MAELGHRGGPKRAFGMLEVETVGAESVEDDADVLQVLRPRGAIYQDIIEKHQHEPAEIWAEDVVHQCLESGRSVGEAKRHHQELVVPLVCPECRLADVFGCIRTW